MNTDAVIEVSTGSGSLPIEGDFIAKSVRVLASSKVIFDGENVKMVFKNTEKTENEKTIISRKAFDFDEKPKKPKKTKKKVIYSDSDDEKPKKKYVQSDSYSERMQYILFGIQAEKRESVHTYYDKYQERWVTE